MFNREKLDTEPKQFRINAYSFEVKLRVPGNAGWKNGRVYAANAFKATSLLAASGDIAEIYFLRRIRGDFPGREQAIEFDE